MNKVSNCKDKMQELLCIHSIRHILHIDRMWPQYFYQVHGVINLHNANNKVWMYINSSLLSI